MTPERKSGTRGEIHSNRTSNISHSPGCSGYDRLSPTHKVLFASEAEAVQAGYRKMKNCPYYALPLQIYDTILPFAAAVRIWDPATSPL